MFTLMKIVTLVTVFTNATIFIRVSIYVITKTTLSLFQWWLWRLVFPRDSLNEPSDRTDSLKWIGPQLYTKSNLLWICCKRYSVVCKNYVVAYFKSALFITPGILTFIFKITRITWRIEQKWCSLTYLFISMISIFQTVALLLFLVRMRLQGSIAWMMFTCS